MTSKLPSLSIAAADPNIPPGVGHVAACTETLEKVTSDSNVRTARSMKMRHFCIDFHPPNQIFVAQDTAVT